jgi:hypothetical protein
MAEQTAMMMRRGRAVGGTGVGGGVQAAASAELRLRGPRGGGGGGMISRLAFSVMRCRRSRSTYASNLSPTGQPVSSGRAHADQSAAGECSSSLN